MSDSTSRVDDRTVGAQRRRGQPGPVTAEALSRLSYLLERPLGCGVVLGPANSGKSTLMSALASGCARSGAATVEIDGQGLDGRTLHWELAAGWRIGSTGDAPSRRLGQQIRDFVQGALASRMRLAIVLDHADRLEHTALLALSRLLHEVDRRRGLTLVWAATAPLSGDAAETLLRFTELRIDCPAPTPNESVGMARDVWQHTDSASATDFPAALAEQFAVLSRGDLRRAERLARLAQLAALAEGAPLNGEMLEAVAGELA